MSTTFEIGDYVEVLCWNVGSHDTEPNEEGRYPSQEHTEMRVTEVDSVNGIAYAECPNCGALNEP